MAITTQKLTVTTTRQQVPTPDTDVMKGTTLWLYGEYHGSSNKIAFGGSDVTLATGIHLYGGEKFGPIFIQSHESLHVISDSAEGLDLRVLSIGAA